jgi:hypothetical protein
LGIAIIIDIGFLGLAGCLSSLLLGTTGTGIIEDPLIKPLLSIGASLFLYIFVLLIGFLLQRRFETRKIIIIIWSLGIIATIFMTLGGFMLPHVIGEIVDVASSVCEGEGIEEAAEYSGSGPHLVVVGNMYEWTNRLPETWLPESTNELELVACLDEEQEELIQTCQYGMGSSWRRFQYKRRIRLLEAKTGEIVAADILMGGVPPQCPSSIISGDNQKYGSHVGYYPLQNWLSDFITSQR